MMRWLALLLVIGLVPGASEAVDWRAWDWNWFRPLVERQASAALGRPVSLASLAVEPGWVTSIEADGVSLAGPGAGDPPTAAAAHVVVRLDIRALYERSLRIEEVRIDSPRLALRRTAGGAASWDLPGLAAGGEAGGEPVFKSVEIGSLAISDGEAVLVDEGLKLDLRTSFATLPAPSGGPPRIVAEARGRYEGQPVTGWITADSVLTLGDPEHPFAIDAAASHGTTRLALRGTIERPLEFGGARLRLELKGDDLAKLYALTGVPMPATPPYEAAGRLDYRDGRFRLDGIEGRLGESDVAGSLAYDPRGARPLLTGELASKRLVLADLAGFLGAAPGRQDRAGETKAQRERRAQEAARPRVLPATPIDLPKLRGADVRIGFRAARIEGDATPVDDLSAELRLEDGAITLEPLRFGVGKGRIELRMTLDGRQDPLRAKGEVEFRNVDVKRLARGLPSLQGVGTIAGRAEIEARGNSVAELLAHGDGRARLAMRGGEMSALMVNLAGLDFGRSLLSALGVPREAPIRCALADLGLKRGVMTADTLLVDTTEANVVGKGTVDFSSEALDMEIKTEPKHFSVGSIPAPIDVTGTLKQPAAAPDAKVLAMRAGAAAALGVVLTPLAALIPTIQLGLGEDADCDALLALPGKAMARRAATPPAPGPARRGGRRS
jgi:uncharacterized protein involved in outer membrane biogenesis